MRSLEQKGIETRPDCLEGLLKAVAGAGRVLILPHNDPDPDALASAVALRHLLQARAGVEARIVYRGIIGRAENKALVRCLGHPLERLSTTESLRTEPVALVDTQPGTGNNAMPPGVPPAIVLDHHMRRGETDSARFADVRTDLGATSTMLTQYLQVAGIEPPARLATALFYGISTDTMGLARETCPADSAAYFYLQTRIDVEALVEIERAQVPADYFRQLSAALHAASVYDEQVVVCHVGAMSRPDMAAEMADLLLRLEGVRWVLCTGVFKSDLFLAVRTRNRRGGAGALAQHMVGTQGSAGGHGMMAGGQIPLKNQSAESLLEQLKSRALTYLRVEPGAPGRALIG